MDFKNTAIATNASAITKLQQEQIQMLLMRLISAETSARTVQMVFKTQLLLQMLQR
jgi:hypothetical protein